MENIESTISRTIPGLAPGERYVVRVRAISKFGVNSDWSEAYDLITDEAGGITDWVEEELTLYNSSHTGADTHSLYALADGSRGAFAKQSDINDAIDELPTIYTHLQSTQSVSAESTSTVSHSFPAGKFSSAPIVTVSALYEENSSDVGCYLNSVSSGSVSVVLYNRSEDAKSIGFHLIAIAE